MFFSRNTPFLPCPGFHHFPSGFVLCPQGNLILSVGHALSTPCSRVFRYALPITLLLEPSIRSSSLWTSLRRDSSLASLACCLCRSFFTSSDIFCLRSCSVDISNSRASRFQSPRFCSLALSTLFQVHNHIMGGMLTPGCIASYFDRSGRE